MLSVSPVIMSTDQNPNTNIALRELTATSCPECCVCMQPAQDDFVDVSMGSTAHGAAGSRNGWVCGVCGCTVHGHCMHQWFDKQHQWFDKQHQLWRTLNKDTTTCPVCHLHSQYSRPLSEGNTICPHTTSAPAVPCTVRNEHQLLPAHRQHKGLSDIDR